MPLPGVECWMWFAYTPTLERLLAGNLMTGASVETTKQCMFMRGKELGTGNPSLSFSDLFFLSWISFPFLLKTLFEC